MRTPPNIILVIADDMGYGDFGIFNPQVSCTPTLDALAEEGICLTQHYSASPVCAPARAALMTGRYPHRTGSIDTLEARGLDRLRPDETTLADVLQSADYATGLIGKWHNGNLGPAYHPTARGYQEFVGFQGGWNPYYRYRLERNGRVEYGDRNRYLTDVFSDEAAAFIDRHHRRAFFLQLAYNAPHFPLEAPEDIAQKYSEMGFGLGVSLIYAMIEIMDAGIQRILDKLDERGIADNTIVIFTSDNGPALGDWNGFSQARCNHGFNGQKGNTYEGGIRVPLIIRWPDGLDGGIRSDEMAHYTDWFPTLLNMVGLDAPPLKLDGVNALAALRGERGQINPRRFWQWNRYTPMISCNAAMRDGDWKLLRPRIPEAMQVSAVDTALDHAIKYFPEHFDDIIDDAEPPRTVPEPPPPLLFNIADDPFERQDLAAQYPDKAASMLSDLEAWFDDVERDRLAPA